MSTRSYPFSAWALTKDYEPIKVELVRLGPFSKHVTARGRCLSDPELHGCKKRAVLWARRAVEKQEQYLKERGEQLERRKLELAKHADL
jgi:hypothetical protein